MATKTDNAFTRVEKHRISPSSVHFAMLADFCYLAKNLYNHANYLVRHQFIETKTWLRYADLDKILKKDTEYPDYKAMPTAQSAQQVLRLLDKNWKSYFASIKDWKNHKEKYLGRPKLPKYKKKNGRFILVLTNQNCKFDGKAISFPKSFHGFKVMPKFASQDNAEKKNQRTVESFQQIRFIPHGKEIVMEIVYTIKKLPS